MKKVILALILLTLFSAGFAQTSGPRGLANSIPKKISYQAVVRNAAGDIVANSRIGLRISILENFTSNVYYTETFVDTTNQFGLFTIEIGTGTVVTGTFDAIPFTLGASALKVEIDPAGGTSYVTMGTQTFSSVPFALEARTAMDAIKNTGGNVNGTLTFTQAPTTADIGIGKFNQSNAVLAYGLIGSDGTIKSAYNVSGVVKSATGVYSITLSVQGNSLLVPVVNAELDGTVNSAATARLAFVDVAGPATFQIFITNGSYSPTDNDFTFVVMAQ